MRGLKAGITGFALAGGAVAAPQQALAMSSFDILGTIGIEVQSITDSVPGSGFGTGPDTGQGVAFVSLPSYTEYQGEVTVDQGDTSYSDFTLNLNAAQFPGAPQVPDGNDPAVPVDLTTLPDGIVGGFRVGFEGVAQTAPLVESALTASAIDLFGTGTPAEQVYEFVSEFETDLTLAITPIVLVQDFTLEPGGAGSWGGRYLFDDPTTTEIDYLVQLFSPDGGDPVLQFFEDGVLSQQQLQILPNGVILTDDFEQITIDIALGPEAAQWAFRYEGIGEITTPAGPPEAEVPVPAALPLLATAMGGLFWMKRRRKA